MICSDQLRLKFNTHKFPVSKQLLLEYTESVQEHCF